MEWILGFWVGHHPGVLLELGLELPGVKTALNVERGMDVIRTAVDAEAEPDVDID